MFSTGEDLHILTCGHVLSLRAKKGGLYSNVATVLDSVYGLRAISPACSAPTLPTMLTDNYGKKRKAH